ncbi:hypothetical protein ACFPRL_29820 [Pseudoclavibacter helvolus]
MAWLLLHVIEYVFEREPSVNRTTDSGNRKSQSEGEGVTSEARPLTSSQRRRAP